MKCALCELDAPMGLITKGKFLCYPCIREVQHPDPIEEGEMWRKYIIEHGWGSVSDLAKLVRRSPSHISQRMSLLEQKELVKLIRRHPPASISTVSTPES